MSRVQDALYRVKAEGSPYAFKFLNAFKSKLGSFNVSYVAPKDSNSLEESIFIFAEGKNFKEISTDSTLLKLKKEWKSNSKFTHFVISGVKHPCLLLYRTVNKVELMEEDSKFHRLKIQIPFRENHEYDDFSESVYDSAMSYGDDIAKAAEKSFKEDKLHEYLDFPLNTKVKSMVLRIPYPTKSVAEIVVMTSESLTDEEKELLLENITGQLSDGWGEGFEQREIASYDTEDYEIEEDEETGETEEVPYTSKVYVYGQFWWNDERGSHKWYIKYI